MVDEMKVYEIGTGYTPIPAQISAATEIIVEELTKAMLAQGCDVRIVDIQASDRAKTELPIIEVPVAKAFAGTDVALGIMHKLKRVAYSVSLARVLKTILKSTDEKVVFHFHNQYNLFFFLKLTPSALRRKCVVAYTNHSGIWRMEWSQIESTVKKRYFQEAECMKQADIVFLLNEETKRNIMEHLGVPERRIRVLNNGVNTDVYHPLTEEEKIHARKEYALENRFVILQVGSVYENKGQLRAAQYLTPILKKTPELVYAYAGGIVDEEYHQQISRYADEQGLSSQIRYLGMLPPGRALNALYNTAAATILPSRYEAFGLVAVESLAAGVPVLVDRMRPIHFGEGCVCYDSDSFELAAERVLRGGADGEYVQLRNAARENAVHNYSWVKIARDYWLVWENLEK